MKRRANLTTPDLVVLGLLAERPMHGYDIIVALGRREPREWAAVSRPQVYYSLQKLAQAKLVRPVRDAGASSGPERRVYAPTATAGRALAEALERADWATHRAPTPFVTWLALSSHARGPAVRAVLARRRGFLEDQLALEKTTRAAVRDGGGVARAIVELAIRQLELELRWLAEVGAVLAPARKPTARRRDRGPRTRIQAE